MKHFKRAAALMLTLCALLALTACGSLQDKVESKLWETAAPALVQGNMDLLYKGACDETYLKLVNSTAEDCASYYDENMTLQAQAFMNVFDVNDLDGTQTDRFADIMKQVYAQAEYTVGAVSQVGPDDLRQCLRRRDRRAAERHDRRGIRQVRGGLGLRHPQRLPHCPE
ncbi:MAG: hypothetical protein KH198_07765 [Oscillibacter sp.]|nr:hypothetical protein [Oscillibacter sp.]